MDIHMGIREIHPQQILQPMFHLYSCPSTFQMDLENKGVKENQNFHLASIQR
jgi:hypothetical protein